MARKKFIESSLQGLYHERCVPMFSGVDRDSEQTRSNCASVAKSFASAAAVAKCVSQSFESPPDDVGDLSRKSLFCGCIVGGGGVRGVTPFCTDILDVLQ